MSAEEVYLEAADKMEKAIAALEGQLRALVDRIRVDYYGAQTPLGQIANIAVPNPQLIVIRPFDPTANKAIEKAILQSDIGITPNNDGKLIRLAIPPLSEERRKQLAALVRNAGEQAKVAIRNIRRELTKDSEKKVDALVVKKSDEIMKF